jgi:hypothetical protein
MDEPPRGDPLTQREKCHIAVVPSHLHDGIGARLPERDDGLGQRHDQLFLDDLDQWRPPKEWRVALRSARPTNLLWSVSPHLLRASPRNYCPRGSLPLAERRGIDLSSLRAVEDIRQVLRAFGLFSNTRSWLPARI